MRLSSVFAAVGIAAAVLAGPARADGTDDLMVDVRGPKLVLYGDAGLKQQVATRTKAEFVALIQQSGGLPARAVAGNPGAWEIVLEHKPYWVKKSQVRLGRNTTYKVNCDQRLAGSSLGASRGIGNSCK